MSCVLHITGDFSTKDVIDLLKIRPYLQFEKGSTSKRAGITYEHSTCSFEVSKADFHHLYQQIDEASKFLERNVQNLQQVTKFNIYEAVLDFGYYTKPLDPAAHIQSYLLPAKLLRLAGNLGINIILSHYSLPADGEPAAESPRKGN